VWSSSWVYAGSQLSTFFPVGLNELAASSPPKRAVVQQRESMEALDKWYKSADYQEALKIGKQHATFRRYAVEGQ
jgi:uncharacterized protein (DUF1330 family)